MGDRKLDRLYRRFQRDGDVDALGKVFDLAAPELSRVARHLCGDEAEAEDALQETFLSAIQKREQYDPARRFMPWMLGILTNRAREARRRSERVPVPSRRATAAGGDPADNAADHELGLAIDAGVAGLPHTYKAAVRAYLADGMKPAEIARTLGISDNAANVRIHRGLRLLRKSLPPATAVSILIGRAPRGLAAVRHVVLEEARAAGGSLAATTTSLAGAGLAGGVLMSKSALAVVMVGLTVLGAWIAWPAQESGHPLAPPSVVDSTTPPILVPDSMAVQSRAPATTQGTTADPRGRLPASMRIHVRYSGGAPASNLEVWVTRYGRWNSGRERRRAVTDGTGAALVADLPEGRVRVYSPLSRSPLRTSDGENDVMVVAGATTAAYFVVPAGCDVRALVQDPAGRPVADADVFVGPRNRLEPSHFMGRTGSDGYFLMKSVAADLSVFACRDGFGISPIVELAGLCAGSVESRERTAAAVLQLDGTVGGLEGSVLRGDGKPAADACVRITSLVDPAGPDLVVQTDVGGRFRIPGLWGYVQLLVLDRDHAPQFERVRIVHEERASVVIQLGPGVTIQGQVRDEAGSSVAGAKIRQSVPDVASKPFQAYLSIETRSSAGGEYVLKGAAIGRHDLVVRAEGRAGGADSSARKTIEARHGEVIEWNPILGGGGTITGHVVDARAQPLVGWTVRAWSAGSEPNPRDAKTDGTGWFELTGCADGTHTVQAWSSSRGTAKVVQRWVRPGGEALVLVVPDPGTAAIEGTVISFGRQPIEGSFVTWKSQSSDRSHAKTGASGRFRVEELGSGSGRLEVSHADHGTTSFGPFDLKDGETFEAGALEFAEPGSVRVKLVPASGAELDDAIRYASVAIHGTLHSVIARRSVDGSFEFDALAPGSYGIAVWAMRIAAATQSVEVVPGERLEVEIPVSPGVRQLIWFATTPGAANPGPYTVRVRDEAGQQVVDLVMAVPAWPRQEDGSYRALFGAALRPGPHTFEVTTASGLAASGTFDVTTGVDSPVVVLSEQVTSD